MATRARRSRTQALKATVALAAIIGEKTLNEFAHQFDLHSNEIKQWNYPLLEELMNNIAPS